MTKKKAIAKKKPALNKKKVSAKKLKAPPEKRQGVNIGPPPEAYGKVFDTGHRVEQKSGQSSLVGQPVQGGLGSGTSNRIRPRIEFWKRQQFYLTVGRVQNVTESYVLNLINREWYYDDTSEGKYEPQVEIMEAWEETIIISRFIASMVRNWIINGVHIISPVDWKPLQLQSLRSKSRDKFGNTISYHQIINGVEKTLNATEFLELPYIEFDREPWPVGMYDSLMNFDYLDIDGRDPRASLELYRQALQDNMKIHHKYASPRVIYTAEGVSKETLDNDIIPVIEGMHPGDRAAFNAKIEIEQETVDGNARFIEHVNKIIDEIDTGLQSSANRLITEPSAMADAREAGAQDDDRTLGIMERVRWVMNREVIPRITGLAPGEVVFKWGAKDSFDLELPEPIEKALNLTLISPEQALIMLENQWHWKVPSPEDIIERFGKTPTAETPTVEEPGNGDADKNNKRIGQDLQPEMLVKMENAKRNIELNKQKVLFIQELRKEMKEL